MKKILQGVAASVLCAAACAEERGPLMDFLHGTYNGGAFGHTTVSKYCEGAYICNDQQDVSFKVYGGLRLTDYLGQELGFISFGRIRSLSGGGISSPVHELSTRTNGFVLNLAPRFALSPNTTVIGRFGVARLHIEGHDGTTEISESKTAPYIGAAFNYKVGAFVPNMLQPLLKTLAVEMAWDAAKTEIGQTDHWFNMISVGTSLEF